MKRGLMVCLLAGLVQQGYSDWPAFRHDNYRSAVSFDNINASELVEAWHWDTGTTPQPAWAGANKKDTFNGHNMVSQRDYDLSYHLISAGSNLYMTSTADDTLYCLNQDSKQVIWKFTAGAPIRNAATYSEGKIYFGSDDGNIYCLNAADGTQLWKFSPVSAGQYETLYNGRLTPLSVCRTGVLIRGNTAYAGFSLLPWEKSYFVAIDKNTGTVTGEGRYIKEYTNEHMTLEAPFAYSAKRFFLPQGRSKPIVLNATNGAKLKELSNRGGTFVLVTPKQKVWNGVSEYRTSGDGFKEVDTASTLVGQVMKSKESHPSKADGSIVTHAWVNEMLYWRKTVFLLGDGKIEAKGKYTWSTNVVAPYTFILSGTTIYAGGYNKIVALNALTGAVIGETAVDGEVRDIIADNGKLFACTSTGQLYAYKQNAAGTAAFVTPSTISPPPAATAGSLKLAAGPFASFDTETTAEVFWKVPAGTAATKVYCGEGAANTEFAATPVAGKADWYKASITGINQRKVYKYIIDCDGVNSAEYEVDSFFNFSLPTVDGALDPYAGKAAATAGIVLSKAGYNKGIALVVGLDDGSLAYELASQSRLRVIAVDTDAGKVAAAREKLLTAKVYGTLVAVKQVTDYSSMNIPDNFANIIVSESGLSLNSTITGKYLNPYRGCALSGVVTADTVKETVSPSVDSADWSHAYGNTDNAAYAGEGLSACSKTEELRPQWIGRPGPRFIIDRSGRDAGPVIANGYFCVHGDHQIAMLDSRNGSILWYRHIPNYLRANVPKDFSPLCIDSTQTYVAVKDKCLVFDNETGDIIRTIDVDVNSAANPGKSWNYDWDYLAVKESQIIGSGVKEGSHSTTYNGSHGWYESRGDDIQTWKVSSENLFAINKSTGVKNWEYYNPSSVIITSTVTIANGHIYFIECRNAAVKALDTRTVSVAQGLFKSVYLMAVSLADGTVTWEKALADDIEAHSLYHMSASEKYGKLVLVVSKTNDQIYCFNMSDGVQQWTLSSSWRNSDHGGHMNRPMIINNRLYVKPSLIDLETGTLIKRISYPYAKCGTYTGASYFHTQRSAMTISGSWSVSMFDLQSENTTDFQKLRPSCWLGTIPANGLLLAQETGGGCSCANGWLETSMAFAPKAQPALMFRYAEKSFYGTSHEVELFNLTGSGSEVRYTTDGTEPSSTSSLYTAPLSISATTTIKAAVFKDGAQVGTAVDRIFTKQ